MRSGTSFVLTCASRGTGTSAGGIPSGRTKLTVWLCGVVVSWITGAVIARRVEVWLLPLMYWKSGPKPRLPAAEKSPATSTCTSTVRG